MVRHRRFGVALIGLALLFALATGIAFAQASLIKNTPHNFAFGGTGTGTIKAASEQQICVFCHTPHLASTSLAAPLWNRQLSAATYTLYSSPYITALGYPSPAVQPKDKSKICLSCHDGTIALGSVYNLAGAGPGTIAMKQGATAITTMPTTTAGYLGTNLADDHPVGYLYDAAKDPELAVRPWPWNTAVKLDPDAGTGTLECHTCHNPHDNQYTKFLRMSNTNAALCTSCHSKTNYALSGHATSTQAYKPSAGATATTVGENSCRNCHKPHSAPGTPLLRGAEENTCYDAGCHGGNNPITGNTTAASGTTWRNIQPEMGKARAHPTNSVSGLHKDLPFVAGTGAESPAQLGSANRHAECPDCHNPHQAQPTVPLPAAPTEKSTRGPLRISLALKGTWGVLPTWPTPSTTMTTNAVTFATPVTFNKVSGAAVTDEYQVCMKCHSNYVTLPVGARNIAAEINPGNSSYHGIVPGGQTNYFVNSTTMSQPWGGSAVFVTGTGTTVNSTEWMRRNPTLVAPATATAYANRGRVWCSDCHGSNASTMPPVAGTKTAPYGPHGSNLTGTTVGTSNSDRMLVKTITSTTAGTPLCLGCHKGTSYRTGNTGSRAAYHSSRSFAEGCFSCHMWDNTLMGAFATGDIYPHGMNKRWISTINTIVGSGQMVDSFNGGWYSNMNYTTKQCWMSGPSNICGGRNALSYAPAP